MGEIRNHPSVLLLIAAFSPSEEVLAAGRRKVSGELGPICLESRTFRFDEFTHYYDQEMGNILYKRFWVFERLIDPGRLAEIKTETNRWETEIADTVRDICFTPRPLNLDPGYIDLGKLILASTKDHCHRIYLRNGIFAETTLIYTKKQWQNLPWTYPDYQSAEYKAFFCECRDYLHARRREAGE